LTLNSLHDNAITRTENNYKLLKSENIPNSISAAEMFQLQYEVRLKRIIGAVQISELRALGTNNYLAGLRVLFYKLPAHYSIDVREVLYQLFCGNSAVTSPLPSSKISD